MLEIKEVSKRYGSKKALERVSLSLPRGEIVGLFGENGAGKTTLMKSILGFIKTDSGCITLDGEPITRKNIAKLSFATSEHSFFPNLSAKSHREFYAEHFPDFSEKRFQALMEFFELPQNRQLRTFSVGQKNQFEVILALSQGADYILMDEPFAALDHFTREKMQQVLLDIHKQNRCGVLFVTHSIDEALAIADRIVILENHQAKKVYSVGSNWRNHSSEADRRALRQDILSSIEF